MADIVLKDIDEVLLARIQNVAKTRGWGMPEALLHLLEHGLFACEPGGGRQFDPDESGVLEAAVAALQQVPDDPGFAMIGRVERD